MNNCITAQTVHTVLWHTFHGIIFVLCSRVWCCELWEVQLVRSRSWKTSVCNWANIVCWTTLESIVKSISSDLYFNVMIIFFHFSFCLQLVTLTNYKFSLQLPSKFPHLLLLLLQMQVSGLVRLQKFEIITETETFPPVSAEHNTYQEHEHWCRM